MSELKKSLIAKQTDSGMSMEDRDLDAEVAESSTTQKEKSFEDEVLSEKKVESKFEKLKLRLQNLTKRQKIILTIGIILLIVFAVSFFSLIFKLDAIFFPSSIEGYVKNQADEAVVGAQVCVRSDCIRTSENGKFILGGLTYGNNTVTITASNYLIYNETVNLKRGRIQKDFQLEPAGYGVVSGKLTGNVPEYDYSKVEMTLHTTSIPVKEDGSFSLSDFPIGTYTLYIKSPDYMDQEIEVEVKEGEQKMTDIVLQPAGDISVKPVDFLTLAVQTEVTAKYDSRAGEVSEDGTILIQDLQVDQTVTVTFSKENYLDKVIDYTVTQGLAAADDVELVRTGKVVYVSNRLGNENVYIANYDGSEEKLLSDNNGDGFSPFMTSDQKMVYFLSTRDEVKTGYGGVIPLLYSVSTEGKNMTKLSKTDYADNNGIGSFDFVSMKRTYITHVYDGEYTSTIYYGNVDGTGTKELVTKIGYINGAIIANNSDFVVFHLSNYATPEDNGLCYLNTDNGSVRKLVSFTNEEDAYPLEISSDRKLLLYRLRDKDSNNWDLYVAGIFDDTKTRLTKTSVFENQGRFTQDGQFVTFISTRDAKTNVYSVGIDGNNEKMLTNDGEVDDYFMGSGSLMFYNSEDVMWIIDTLDAKKPQKVTEKVLGTYYSSHYYYYGD